MYQTIPFEGYEGAATVRGDCGMRWAEISKHLPSDLSDLSFMDYGCAEGYFLFRALQQGAKKSVFIDHDKACLEFADTLAMTHGYRDKCSFYEKEPDINVDVCFYLDVHFNGVHPTVEWFRVHCKTLFISPSGNGDENSPKLEKKLKEVFKTVTSIYRGYENRVIFKCGQ